MLSTLQQRVALLVADLVESSGFVLAGDGAFVARGHVERTTRDLDYFGTRPEQVLALLPGLGTSYATLDFRSTGSGLPRISHDCLSPMGKP